MLGKLELYELLVCFSFAAVTKVFGPRFPNDTMWDEDILQRFPPFSRTNQGELAHVRL